MGFTTPSDRGRSSRYCTDYAKQVGAPVIRVNGEYPEVRTKKKYFVQKSPDLFFFVGSCVGHPAGGGVPAQVQERHLRGHGLLQEVGKQNFTLLHSFHCTIDYL